MFEMEKANGSAYELCVLGRLTLSSYIPLLYCCQGMYRSDMQFLFEILCALGGRRSWARDRTAGLRRQLGCIVLRRVPRNCEEACAAGLRVGEGGGDPPRG